MVKLPGRMVVNNLPSADTFRWTIQRKAEVVGAVRNGLLGLDEACERYRLSVEEFLTWEQLIAAHGLRGLKVSRIHEYRQSERENNPAQRLPRDGMSRDGLRTYHVKKLSVFASPEPSSVTSLADDATPELSHTCRQRALETSDDEQREASHTN